jgi:hypothetical protein
MILLARRSQHLSTILSLNNKIDYYEKPECDKHREFINSQSNCVLCGAVLELSHAVDHIIGHIREEAHCPSCEVRTRARFHPLN